MQCEHVHTYPEMLTSMSTPFTMVIRSAPASSLHPLPFRATPGRSGASSSAPTGGSWPPAVMTLRPGCGTCPPARPLPFSRCAHSDLPAGGVGFTWIPGGRAGQEGRARLVCRAAAGWRPRYGLMGGGACPPAYGPPLWGNQQRGAQGEGGGEGGGMSSSPQQRGYRGSMHQAWWGLPPSQLQSALHSPYMCYLMLLWPLGQHVPLLPKHALSLSSPSPPTLSSPPHSTVIPLTLRATPGRSTASFSAPTGGSWPPAVMTIRRGCGTCPPARPPRCSRCAHSEPPAGGRGFTWSPGGRAGR